MCWSSSGGGRLWLTIRGLVDVDQQHNALVSKHQRQQACRFVPPCATHLSIILESPALVGHHMVAAKLDTLPGYMPQQGETQLPWGSLLVPNP
jgi:hypothetical protein